jgi:shikimate kinase
MKGPVVLIGLMGAGKTTVGRALAELLEWPWVDLDLALEERWKLSVPRQFETVGEAGFRRRERELLQELGAGGRRVISAGGGVVLEPSSRALLKRWTSVYLSASPDVLARRLRGPQALKRPLLAGGGVEEKLRRLAKLRGPYYRDCAAITVRASQGTASAVAQRVWWRLRQGPS